MTALGALSTRATVHLVRHGEVENPKGVVYGRLPGYNLSEKGKRQAEEAARRLEDADVGCVWASPLERAQETAAIIARPHGLDVVTDERLTESSTTLEGATRTLVGFIRSPRHWWSFRNPLRPSWGESFTDIGSRMVAAVRDAIGRADGKDVVIVSHQTPVRVARLALGRRRIPPWLVLTRCSTGSVTSVVLAGDSIVSASYFEPTGA